MRPARHRLPMHPRVARLLALAHRLEALLRAGVVKDYATLARLGHVSRGRICQIVSLLQLAPDIQEEILYLGRPERGSRPAAFAAGTADCHGVGLGPAAPTVAETVSQDPGNKTSMLLTGGS